MILPITLFLSFISFITSSEVPNEDGVLVLSEGNFDDVINQGQILVEFYAPWCGHCKKLAPELVKAAKMLEGEGAQLGKVDCTVESGLQEKYGIKGFPTLKYFKNGKVIDYNAGRTAPDIVSWVKKQSGPAAKKISNMDELGTLQEMHDVVILGYFDSEESDLAKSFMSFAGAADDNLFYSFSSSNDLKSSLGLSGNTIVLLKKFDERRNDLSIETFDDASVAKFVISNSAPLVQQFSQESSKKIFASPIQKHALIFTNAKDDNQNMLSNFRDIAAAFRGFLLVVNVPSDETKVLEYFGINAASLPTLVVIDMSSRNIKKYPFGGDIMDSASVKSHISSMLEGKLAPSLKSEVPVPEDTAGDVVVLKGKSFNEIVMNNDKDVLVEFYAPWCGHCKKLAPTWDELGATFKNNDNIVIAKMDSTANEVDVEGLVVQGFPTIYFFPGKNKRPVKYEAGRELDDFIEYLKEHSSHKFSADEL